MFFHEPACTGGKSREHIFDYYRSIFMVFVFFHHAFVRWPTHRQITDFTEPFNAFAELFVCLAGFMVGYIYLAPGRDSKLFDRGIRILIIYLVVATLVGAKSAVAGTVTTSVWKEMLSTLLLSSDKTYIGILRFYGFLFIAAPVFLKLYRRSGLLFFLLSFTTTGAATFYRDVFLSTGNFFITNTLLVFMQWQVFFCLGIGTGDAYRRRFLSPSTIKVCGLFLVALGFSFRLWNMDNFDFQKFPMSPNKFITVLYMGPIILYLGYLSYRLVRGLFPDRFVRVVGRNSLLAFVISELAFHPVYLLHHVFPNQELSPAAIMGCSALFTVGLIWLLWGVEKYAANRKIATVQKIEASPARTAERCV